MTSQLRWQYEASNTGDHIITIKLWPYRSLSLQGFKIVMTALSLAIFSLGLGFCLLGAWPVIGFLGAEIGLVWFAFRFNYRAGQLIEEITISPISVIITRTDWRGRHTKQILDSAWIKAELVPKKARRRKLFLRHHSELLEIGAFLPPAEKPSLASALNNALAQAKLTPPIHHPS